MSSHRKAVKLQLFVRTHGGRTISLHIDKTKSIRHLTYKVAQLVECSPDDIQLFYAGEALKEDTCVAASGDSKDTSSPDKFIAWMAPYDDFITVDLSSYKTITAYERSLNEQLERKTLEDFHLAELSTLQVVWKSQPPKCSQSRIRNGHYAHPRLDAKKFKKVMEDKALKQMFGYVSVSTEGQDMISLETGRDSKAVMPCGHIIGPNSLEEYCKHVLLKGVSTIQCPQCSECWPYFAVKHAACLSPDKMAEYDVKVTENYLTRAPGYQVCPTCHAWLYKDPDSQENSPGKLVLCPVCDHLGNERKVFCWACLRHQPETNDGMCRTCDGRHMLQHYLNSCQKKDIDGMKAVPSVRACPHCWALIEHMGGCRRMTCKNCKMMFCFVCLRYPNRSGSWPCVMCEDTCFLAPTQLIDHMHVTTSKKKGAEMDSE